MTSPLVQFSTAQKIQHFWVRHRWTDLILSATLAAAWLYAGYRGCIPLVLTSVPAEARHSVFQILATIAGTMAGFVLTSISILVNLLRTPMTTIDKLLPAEDKRTIGGVFLGTLPRLLLLFVLALIALQTDTSTSDGYWLLQLLTLATAVAGVLALARVVWALRRLLALSSD